MCGIVAAVAERNVTPILLDGLQRLEYRGYDSAGIAVLNQGALIRRRTLGKVAQLAACCTSLVGFCGIAHTRWATHGAPSERNAHPHTSGDLIAVVHNGIIENYQELRTQLETQGYVFSSETDSEAIAHALHARYLQNGRDLREAMSFVAPQLEGSFSLVVCAADRPDELVATRRGSPLVIGVGLGEHFIASDSYALLSVTRRFVYLAEGDLVQVRRKDYTVWDANGRTVHRPLEESAQDESVSGKDGHKHFMHKEIFQQPEVVAETLEGRVWHGELNRAAFAPDLLTMLQKIKQLHIVACGTSYHAGLVMRYAFERDGYPTQVEVASEYLYREVAIAPETLFVCLSQSGETADTLAALKKAKASPYAAYLAICNVPESALVRAAGFSILTRAGREISVASTKAFVTQLVVLHLLRRLLGAQPPQLFNALACLPEKMQALLNKEAEIAHLASALDGRHGCLFLGRGDFAPIAQEGALKLKELSYIHAEAYPAGELKHGPLALVDKEMVVVALVKADAYAEKTLGNLQEVKARGGRLLIFADARVDLQDFAEASVFSLGILDEETAACAAILPLQLLAYHVALRHGTDIDQPRNLAKSVTVE